MFHENVADNAPPPPAFAPGLLQDLCVSCTHMPASPGLLVVSQGSV
jgi:hypothetical protein